MKRLLVVFLLSVAACGRSGVEEDGMFEIAEVTLDSIAVATAYKNPDRDEFYNSFVEWAWVEVPNRTGQRFQGISIDPYSDVHECDVILDDVQLSLTGEQVIPESFTSLKVRIKQPMMGNPAAWAGKTVLYPFSPLGPLPPGDYANYDNGDVKFGVAQQDPPPIIVGTMRLRLWDENPREAKLERVRRFYRGTFKENTGVFDVAGGPLTLMVLPIRGAQGVTLVARTRAAAFIGNGVDMNFSVYEAKVMIAGTLEGMLTGAMIPKFVPMSNMTGKVATPTVPAPDSDFLLVKVKMDRGAEEFSFYVDVDYGY